jgi:hypothetical protein
MPIAYERDDARRLIIVTVTEPYAVGDILETIDRQAAENTWEYAMLYEMQAAMTIAADSQQIANHVERVAGGHERGPVGIAMSGDPEQFRRGLKYTELTRKIATVEVLLTATQREDWLARCARRRRPR